MISFINYRPFNLKNAISHLSDCVDAEERKKWTECALQDWETFLTCRAKEIKPGTCHDVLKSVIKRCDIINTLIICSRE